MSFGWRGQRRHVRGWSTERSCERCFNGLGGCFKVWEGRMALGECCVGVVQHEALWDAAEKLA